MNVNQNESKACLVSLWSSLPAGSYACARVLALWELRPWGSLLWTYLVNLPPGKVSFQRLTRERHLAFFPAACHSMLRLNICILNQQPACCLVCPTSACFASSNQARVCAIVCSFGLTLPNDTVLLVHTDASSHQKNLMEDCCLHSTSSTEPLKAQRGGPTSIQKCRPEG